MFTGNANLKWHGMSNEVTENHEKRKRETTAESHAVEWDELICMCVCAITLTCTVKLDMTITHRYKWQMSCHGCTLCNVNQEKKEFGYVATNHKTLYSENVGVIRRSGVVMDENHMMGSVTTTNMTKT